MIKRKELLKTRVLDESIDLGSTCRNPTEEEIKKIRDDFTKVVADTFNISLSMIR